MNHTLRTPILLAAAAFALVVAAPAQAGPGGGHPNPGERFGDSGSSELLDEDYTLSSSLDINSPGTTRTRTVTDDEGTTRTIVVRRKVKAAGSATSDLKTAAGGDPGALSAALKFSTKTVDPGNRDRLHGTYTVRAADGKVRVAIVARLGDDGSFEGRVRAGRGSGSFAGIRVNGDVDGKVTDSTVTLELDGEYGYGEAAGPGPANEGGPSGRRPCRDRGDQSGGPQGGPSEG